MIRITLVADFMDLSDAKKHDVREKLEIEFPTGNTEVVERGYLSF